MIVNYFCFIFYNLNVIVIKFIDQLVCMNFNYNDSDKLSCKQLLFKIKIKCLNLH